MDEKIYAKAEQIAWFECLGFIEHDKENYELAAKYFSRTYLEAYNISKEKAEEAAKNHVDALKVKDQIDKEKDRRKRFVDHRWKRVCEKLQAMAEALEVEDNFAYHTTEFWRKHKGERDYWSDCFEAQKIFLKSKIKKEWQEKKSDGRNGAGLLPTLYLASVEGHDLHSDEAWEITKKINALYYYVILISNENK